MHVLLVEDDPLVREVLAEGLAEAGLAVSTAASAEDVLSLTDGVLAPDMLVTDVNLPGCDGFALAAEARERWPGLRAVFISGRPMNLEGNVLDPRDSFLMKPFTGPDLVSAIRATAQRPGDPAVAAAAAVAQPLSEPAIGANETTPAIAFRKR